MKYTKRILPGLVVLLLAAGCAPEPEPIRYGEEPCTHCMMTIADTRYGAELVTGKGKVYKFDAVECLAAFLQEGQVVPGEIHSLWVTDFRSPPNLIPAEEAFYLHSPNLRSPMGANLTAFGDQIDPEAVLNSFGGEILSWPEVRQLVQGGAAHAAHLHGAQGGE